MAERRKEEVERGMGRRGRGRKGEKKMDFALRVFLFFF